MFLLKSRLNALALFTAFMAAAIPVAAQAPAELGPNLLKNGGFEPNEGNVTLWNLQGDVSEIREDKPMSHGGSSSLRFTNTDPQVYKTITQTVPAKPGDVLHFSVWVKGKEVTSVNPNSGAGIYMEGLDAGGNWVTGAYAACFTGTYDWQQSSSVYRVPATASKVVVGLYMRRDTVGTAWFDDVEVCLERDQSAAVKTALLYPNYRGLVKTGSTLPWQIQLQLRDSASTVTASSTLSDNTGKVISQQQHPISAGVEKQTLSLAPPKNLKAGDYNWQLKITDASGTVHTPKYTIHVVNRMPENYVDAEGYTVANGQRIFPLGVYVHGTENEDLDLISKAGFNMVLSYSYGVEKGSEAYLDRAKKNNLHVVFSLKDFYEGFPYAPKGVTDLNALTAEIVGKVRDKPALLGWYINDEMEPEQIPKIQARYDQLVRLDANHPVLSMLIDPGISEPFLPSTDLIGSDPYPVTGGDGHLRRTTSYTQLSAGAAGKAKSVWMAAQIFDFANYGGSHVSYQPNSDEIRNQAYQAIIGGAKALIFYSFFDLWYKADAVGVKNNEVFQKRWADVRVMSQEIKELSPAILNGKAGTGAVENAGASLRAIEYKNELLVMVANPFYKATQPAIEIPAGWTIKQPKQGNLQGTLQGSTLTLQVPSIGSGVFRLVRK